MRLAARSPAVNVTLMCACFTVAYLTLAPVAIAGTIVSGILTIASMRTGE